VTARAVRAGTAVAPEDLAPGDGQAVTAGSDARGAEG